MLGWDDLKESIRVTENSVECPVRGCKHTVERQRRTFLVEPRFQCPEHMLYISPSTFEYSSVFENMLWTDSNDKALWAQITQPGVKRECRVARDNSEDAVTWNVFRLFERRGLLGDFLSIAHGSPIEGSPRIIYWSLCQMSKAAWPELTAAATEFGEVEARRSEPDLIIEDDSVLAFVENKVTASNRTTPSNPLNVKAYQTGGEKLFSKIFRPTSDFKAVAVKDRLYELMRLWLIGNHIARKHRKPFILINIVRADAGGEADIGSRFGRHIVENEKSRFVPMTWEQLRDLIVIPRKGDKEIDRLLTFFASKTLGYVPRRKDGVQEGVLRRAFRPWAQELR